MEMKSRRFGGTLIRIHTYNCSLVNNKTALAIWLYSGDHSFDALLTVPETLKFSPLSKSDRRRNAAVKHNRCARGDELTKRKKVISKSPDRFQGCRLVLSDLFQFQPGP